MIEARAFDELTASLPPVATVHVSHAVFVHNVGDDGPGPCRRGESWGVVICDPAAGCVGARAVTGPTSAAAVHRALRRWRAAARLARSLGVPPRVALPDGRVIRVRVTEGRMFLRGGGQTWETAYLPDPPRRVTIAGIVPPDRRPALLERATRELTAELERRAAA
jgi:hypothetical protein